MLRQGFYFLGHGKAGELLHETDEFMCSTSYSKNEQSHIREECVNPIVNPGYALRVKFMKPERLALIQFTRRCLTVCNILVALQKGLYTALNDSIAGDT